MRRRREVPRCPAVAWQHGEPTGSSSPDGDVLFARVRSIPEFVKVVGIAATWSSQQHRDARGGQMLPTWGAERTRRVNSLDSWLAPAPIWRPGPPHPGAARQAGAVIPRRRLRTGRLDTGDLSSRRRGRPVRPREDQPLLVPVDRLAPEPAGHRGLPCPVLDDATTCDATICATQISGAWRTS